MSSLEAGSYLRNLRRFTFREEGALTIPYLSADNELGWKNCYHLAVDVIIESITREEYRNYRSAPAYGFYGYASVVKQDCLLLPIELKFGRQRIYEEAIPAAFQSWANLAFWLNTNKRFLEVLNKTTNLCDVAPFPFDFEPLSIREVYIKCLPFTQFSVELYWVNPQVFTDDCQNTHKGESKKTDASQKDKGLPSNGTQPKHNDSSDPYKGNQPLSVPPLGSPYRNDKSGTLDNIDGSNTSTLSGVPATATTPGYYLSFYLQKALTGEGPDTTVNGFIYIACYSDSVLNVTNEATTSQSFTCGIKTVYRKTVRITHTSFIQQYAFIADSPISGEVSFGLLPSQPELPRDPNGACN